MDLGIGPTNHENDSEAWRENLIVARAGGGRELGLLVPQSLHRIHTRRTAGRHECR